VEVEGLERPDEDPAAGIDAERASPHMKRDAGIASGMVPNESMVALRPRGLGLFLVDLVGTGGEAIEKPLEVRLDASIERSQAKQLGDFFFAPRFEVDDVVEGRPRAGEAGL
jgi:hypothetical protein